MLESSISARDDRILTSDHGNVEDPLPRNHTLKSRPHVAWVPGRGSRRRVRTLADITPTILKSLPEGELAA